MAAWIRVQAEGTTLGADNGIGVCAALALLSSSRSAKLPPLECLFTVDEETGLTGAFQLDGSIVTGAMRSQTLSREPAPHPYVISETLGQCTYVDLVAWS